jgi:hypothetical protein
MDHHRGAPIYNYARLVTWSLAVEKLHAAFQAASSRANKELPVNSGTGWSKNRKGELAPSNRRGSPAQVADYIQSRDHKILLPDLGWRSLNSSVMALFLTWGTIGPAVVLDSALPTKGESSFLGLLRIGTYQNRSRMQVCKSPCIRHIVHRDLGLDGNL